MSDVANAIAKSENVEMSPNHWEVVNFLRKYYEEYQIAPAVRVLTKAIGKQLGPDKAKALREDIVLLELKYFGPNAADSSESELQSVVEKWQKA